MAFGEFQSRRDHHGQWMVIPYDGAPSVQLFLPDRKTHTSNGAVVFWKGWLTPDAVVAWVGVAFALVEGNPQCESELWSSQIAKPQVYQRGTLGALSQNLAGVKEDVVVTLRVQSEPSTETRFYVWGDLRQGPSPAGMEMSLPDGGVSEVGIEVSPADLRESTGKAIIGNLLMKSSSLKLETDEIEDLLHQLESKLLLWR
jgi:hypothetical protein